MNLHPLPAGEVEAGKLAWVWDRVEGVDKYNVSFVPISESGRQEPAIGDPRPVTGTRIEVNSKEFPANKNILILVYPHKEGEEAGEGARQSFVVKEDGTVTTEQPTAASDVITDQADSQAAETGAEAETVVDQPFIVDSKSFCVSSDTNASWDEPIQGAPCYSVSIVGPNGDPLILVPPDKHTVEVGIRCFEFAPYIGKQIAFGQTNILRVRPGDGTAEGWGEAADFQFHINDDGKLVAGPAAPKPQIQVEEDKIEEQEQPARVVQLQPTSDPAPPKAAKKQEQPTEQQPRQERREEKRDDTGSTELKGLLSQLVSQGSRNTKALEELATHSGASHQSLQALAASSTRVATASEKASEAAAQTAQSIQGIHNSLAPVQTLSDTNQRVSAALDNVADALRVNSEHSKRVENQIANIPGNTGFKANWKTWLINAAIVLLILVGLGYLIQKSRKPAEVNARLDDTAFRKAIKEGFGDVKQDMQDILAAVTNSRPIASPPPGTPKKHAPKRPAPAPKHTEQPAPVSTPAPVPAPCVAAAPPPLFTVSNSSNVQVLIVTNNWGTIQQNNTGNASISYGPTNWGEPTKTVYIEPNTVTNVVLYEGESLHTRVAPNTQMTYSGGWTGMQQPEIMSQIPDGRYMCQNDYEAYCRRFPQGPTSGGNHWYRNRGCGQMTIHITGHITGRSGYHH